MPKALAPYSRKYILLATLGKYSLQYLRPYHQEDHQLLVHSQNYDGEQVMVFGVYERFTLQSLMNSLDFDPSEHLALDVGANIGNHSCYFSTHFSEVMSFEPNPLIFEILRFNTSSRPQVKAYNYGLSDVEGEAYFEVEEGHWGIGRIVQHKTSQKIKVKAFDETFEDHVVPAFIKIDVEGHEAHVIKGMQELLTNHKPLIGFELIKQVGEKHPKTIEVLKSLGYTQFFAPKHVDFWLDTLPRFARYFYFLKRLLFPLRPEKLTMTPLNKFDKPYYTMIVAQHPDSSFKLKD